MSNFVTSPAGECLVAYDDYTFSDDGRVPISSRRVITGGDGKEYQMGDIIQRPGVGVPLIVVDEKYLDDGTGRGRYVWLNTQWEKIGSVYEDYSRFVPLLAEKELRFNKRFYGIGLPGEEVNEG